MDEQTAKNQKENGTRKSLNKQDSLVLKIVLIAFLILVYHPHEHDSRANQ